jgi:hypothetical protein
VPTSIKLVADSRGLPVTYFASTQPFRKDLDPESPSLEQLTAFARIIVEVLNGYAAFLAEDADPTNLGIRAYMEQEIKLLLEIRKGLIDDLGKFFTDDKVSLALSRVTKKEMEETVTGTCLDELELIRTAVKVDLREYTWAVGRDLENDHVTSMQEQKSLTATLQCLQSVAEKWTSLSDQLSAAGNIGNQQGTARATG